MPLPPILQMLHWFFICDQAQFRVLVVKPNFHREKEEGLWFELLWTAYVSSVV